MVFLKTDLIHDPDYEAEVEEARPGWIAYWTRDIRWKGGHTTRARIFLIRRWLAFRENYDPEKPPSVWDHLLNKDDKCP